jgi:type I restriction enzyme, R subunit
LAQAYEDRQIETRDALERFQKLAEEYLNADEERKKLGLDENTFAIYMALKPEVADLNTGQAMEIDAIFEEFPDYAWNEDQKRRLRAKLYMPIRGLAGPSKMIEVTDTLLRLQRR